MDALLTIVLCPPPYTEPWLFSAPYRIPERKGKHLRDHKRVSAFRRLIRGLGTRPLEDQPGLCAISPKHRQLRTSATGAPRSRIRH